MANHDSFGAAKIAETIRDKILAGTLRDGEYLSSVRALSHEFGCAPLTAHRALKQLAGTGLVVAEPRSGYRVIHRNRTPRTQEMVAFLEQTQGYENVLGDIYETQLAVLQRGALARGWVSALLPYSGQSAETIERQLQDMKATALILQDVGENFPPSLLADLVRLGLPTIGLDMASIAPGLDLVMRDEAHGAWLAAEYLLRKGHRRIGWFGPLTSTYNARRRFAGAAEALLREQIDIGSLGWRETEPAVETRVALEFLRRPDRPPAVLALWQTAARSIARAARELGLKLGRDLDVVGWSLDEHLDRRYAQECPELRESCAAVTWSMADLGRAIFGRIEQRRREPDAPAVRILLPMKLREPGT